MRPWSVIGTGRSYCGAKHAIRGFTDSLRCELLHDGSNVHVTMVQLPALNTPQFNWCKSRLPNHPQPVPPIFQPEVAARAIVWAAEHHRREVNVGYPSSMTIWLNKFLPGFGDRYLAKQGYDSQQTGQPVDPNRFNLFEPVAGDHGAHGMFDQRSTDRSWQWWLTTHRGWVAGAAACVAALLALGIAMGGSSGRRRTERMYEALDDAVSVDWGAHRHQCQHCGQHGQR
jgi:hypothetical protein